MAIETKVTKDHRGSRSPPAAIVIGSPMKGAQLSNNEKDHIFYSIAHIVGAYPRLQETNSYLQTSLQVFRATSSLSTLERCQWSPLLSVGPYSQG